MYKLNVKEREWMWSSWVYVPAPPLLCHLSDREQLVLALGGAWGELGGSPQPAKNENQGWTTAGRCCWLRTLHAHSSGPSSAAPTCARQGRLPASGVPSLDSTGIPAPAFIQHLRSDVCKSGLTVLPPPQIRAALGLPLLSTHSPIPPGAQAAPQQHRGPAQGLRPVFAIHMALGICCLVWPRDVWPPSLDSFPCPSFLGCGHTAQLPFPCPLASASLTLPHTHTAVTPLSLHYTPTKDLPPSDLR